MKNVITLVLGGGRGSRLYPLTRVRAKPAVPLAGKYRLIDIPLSNCINSGLNKIYVLTQFLSVSLHRHIRQTYRFDPFTGGFVELLAAQQTDNDKQTDWYEGTADAVRKNLDYVRQPGIDYVLILSGDQLYRMDYREMIQTHIDSRAVATIGTLPVSRQDAGGLGIMRATAQGRVEGFLEKPQTDAEIDMVRMDPDWFCQQGIHREDCECLASMGIYLFNRNFLVDALEKTPYQDFGKEVFPAAVHAKHVQVHLFDGYWEDIGTIRAFFEANLSLARPNPPFQLSSAVAPVYTRARFLPPALLQGAKVKNSLIAEGCQIGHNAVIENSVIGLRCVIGEGVTIRDSIVMGADFYETDDDLQQRHSARPGIGIGPHSLISGAIVDKNCRIGSHVRVINETNTDHFGEDLPCVLRDGIPVVVKNAILPDGWNLGGIQ